MFSFLLGSFPLLHFFKNQALLPHLLFDLTPANIFVTLATELVFLKASGIVLLLHPHTVGFFLLRLELRCSQLVLSSLLLSQLLAALLLHSLGFLLLLDSFLIGLFLGGKQLGSLLISFLLETNFLLAFEFILLTLVLELDLSFLLLGLHRLLVLLVLQPLLL